jgi:hypothetical protein
MHSIHYFLALALCSPALAQTKLVTVLMDRKGPAMIAPDLYGDAVRDLWIGDPAGSAAPGQPGRVLVASGSFGTSLAGWSGEAGGDLYGSVLAGVGDLDGDGVRDIAVGAPGPGLNAAHRPYVQIRSSRSMDLLLRFEGQSAEEGLGSSLVALGDLDMDGVIDLAVGASGSASGAAAFVEVRSGSSGAVIWRTPAVSAGGSAISLAAMDDLDGDGQQDLAIGYAGVERVEVRSGFDGLLLRSLAVPDEVGFGFPTAFGASVVSGADFDGDGHRELLVGAPYEFISDPSAGGYEGTMHRGSVYIFSGANLTSRPRLRVTAYNGHVGFGTSIASLGDFDGDGVPDFVTGDTLSRTGCCHYHPGSANVLSGSDGSTLMDLPPGTGGQYSSAGDWNSDGLADYLVSGAALVLGGPYELSIVAGQLPMPNAD